MIKNLCLVHYLEHERKRTIDECRKCGLCNRKCPIIKQTDLNDHSSQDIQKGVIDFLETGVENDAAYIRGFACMRCFQCVDNFCPQGLNSYPDPKSHDAPHRIIASIQIPSKDLKRITTPSSLSNKEARYVLFPVATCIFSRIRS